MSYAEAHFPAGSLVAGVCLQPLSMGHALLLARLGCPLIPGGAGRSPQAGDVAMLLWVCSRSWRRAVKHLRSRIARWWRAFVAGRVYARETLVRQQVETYLRAQLTGPQMRPAQGASGKRLFSPTLGLIKVAAMVELGLSEEDVLDRPLRLTLWEVAVAAERRGEVELVPSLDAFQDLLSAAKSMEPEAPNNPEVPNGR